jgi:hypothetical protein
MVRLAARLEQTHPLHFEVNVGFSRVARILCSCYFLLPSQLAYSMRLEPGLQLIYGGETVQLEFIPIKTKVHLQEKATLTNTLYDNHVYTTEQSLHEASQCTTTEIQPEDSLEVVNTNSPASFLT